MTPELELLEALRETTLSPTQEELLDALERTLKADALWPLPVRETAEAIFGGGIHNPKGRDHGSLDRRVRHAMKVWRNRYHMNPAQMVYAGDVLARAMQAGARDAGSDTSKKRAYVFKRLEQAVNHDGVHTGFKARSGHVNVTAQLEAIA